MRIHKEVKEEKFVLLNSLDIIELKNALTNPWTDWTYIRARFSNVDNLMKKVEMVIDTYDSRDESSNKVTG